MEFIICNEKGEEVTLLTDGRYIDMEIGDSNSFSIEISKDYQKRWGIDSGWWIGCPGKEYGGIINKVVSSDNVITISGSTWRGMLTKKILQPPSGEDYLSVSGDADTIINNVICSEFSGIFVCDTLSGVQYSGYKFDRYVNSLAGIEKMLFSKNLKLSIEYDSGEPNGKSFVRIKSTPIHDFSDEIEYSKDGTLSYIYFSFEKFTGGINHLICLGKGELKDRLVLHLYADENGNIGTEQHFFGADEREATYDYSSAGTEEDLRKNGTEKFKELLSYKSMDMDLFNETLAGLRGINDDISIGDIVGGRDFDTGIYLSKQITRKIVQVKNGRESIEYGVGKPVLNRNSANAPVEQSDPLDKLIKVTADGTGLAVGKDAELSNVFDVGLAPIFRNTTSFNIPNGTDISKEFTSWAYGVMYRQDAGITVSNAPDGHNTGQYVFYYRFHTFLIANVYSGRFYIVDTTNGVFNNGWQDLRIPNKVRAGTKAAMWTDDEGGNIEVLSPNDVLWQIDAHDNNLRFYTFGADGAYRNPFTLYTDGGVGCNGALYAYGGLWLGTNWVNDFVVNQGTSGIWEYRLWESGKAECWCDNYGDIQWGATAEGMSYNYFSMALPFRFSYLKMCMVNVMKGNYLSFATANTDSGYNKDSVEVKIMQYANAGATPIRFAVYCYGTWK